MKSASVRENEGKSAKGNIPNKDGSNMLLQLIQQCILAINRVHRQFRKKPWVSDYIVIKKRQIIFPVKTWNEIYQEQETNRSGVNVCSRDEALLQRTFSIMESLLREVKGNTLV